MAAKALDNAWVIDLDCLHTSSKTLGILYMLELDDDWGNPSPTGAGTDWFGFAALFLKDNEIQEMRNLYKTICQRLCRSSDAPLQSRKLDLEKKYYITKLIGHANRAVSIVAVQIHAVTLLLTVAN